MCEFLDERISVAAHSHYPSLLRFHKSSFLRVHYIFYIRHFSTVHQCFEQYLIPLIRNKWRIYEQALQRVKTRQIKVHSQKCIILHTAFFANYWIRCQDMLPHCIKCYIWIFMQVLAIEKDAVILVTVRRNVLKLLLDQTILHCLAVVRPFSGLYLRQ